MSAEKNEERNLPQIKTQQNWRNHYPWLDFSNDGMKCLLCCEWERKLSNLRLSMINSPVVNSLNRASVKEKESLHKLFEVAYLIAKKGRLFIDYRDLIELEKLYGVKLMLLTIIEMSV